MKAINSCAKESAYLSVELTRSGIVDRTIAAGRNENVNDHFQFPVTHTTLPSGPNRKNTFSFSPIRSDSKLVPGVTTNSGSLDDRFPLFSPGISCSDDCLFPMVCTHI